MPVLTYVEKMNVAYSGQDKRKYDDQGKPIDTSKGYYIPWYDRMAQEEAESLNKIKRTTWEQCFFWTNCRSRHSIRSFSFPIKFK